MEKQFTQLQLGLFFKNSYKGATENASLDIKGIFGFDMETQILNVPLIAPPEIPRLILTSPVKGKLNINLSQNRIDFFTNDDLFAVNSIENIFAVITKLGVEIGRVGLVLNFIGRGSLADLKSLLNNSKIDSSSIKEIMVRLNEKAVVSGVECNNSQMYTSGFIKDSSGATEGVVIITRDINSLSEDLPKKTFNREALKGFLIAATDLAKKTVL